MSVDIESRIRRANLIIRDEQLQKLFGDETSERLLLDILAKKESRVTDIRPDQPTSSEKVATDEITSGTPQRLRLGAAFAAFAVVVAAGIGFVLVRDTDTAAGPSRSPVEVGEKYISAIDEWDSETALALLAPGAAMIGLAESPTDIPAVFDFYRANDWRFPASECQQTNVSEPVVVNCTYTHHNAWMRALDVDEPIPGGSYEFVIANGKIEEVRQTHKDHPDWGIFTLWVANNHNADFLVLVPDGCCVPSVTPEAIILWEKYTDEFVAEQAG